MTLRYMPKEAEPIRAEIVNLENELVSKFSNLFTVISWLDSDRWDLYYRPAYFGTFTKDDRRNCRYVHDKASYGKTGRSFGLTYDLYLIQMNNLNFGNALAGPGLRYKDGELAKIYINRIIDSSNDMATELDKLSMATRQLRVAFGDLPSTHDKEWERRYKKIDDLITNIEEAIDECDDAVDKREALGDQLLMVWFPETEIEQKQVVSNPLVEDGTEGTVDNPFVLKETQDTPIFDTEHDITSLVDFSDRDAQTYFNFKVSKADQGRPGSSNLRPLQCKIGIRMLKCMQVIDFKVQRKKWSLQLHIIYKWCHRTIQQIFCFAWSIGSEFQIRRLKLF